MATGTLVSVEEYLNTSYDPDREYVDGEIVERNVGEKEHSRLQFLLGLYLGAREKQWGIVGFTEQRVQVTPTRFRIPDICVVIAPEPEDAIFYSPPFLCIEILSREDRYHAMLEKIDDYLNFGVKYVWVIDPKTRKAHIYSASGVTEAKDGILTTSNPDIAVSLSEI
jgi:Uma2 family endonuclease